MAVLRLEQIGPRDLRRVGGKAMGLARLVRAGVSVPSAVVIPVDVFQKFLKSHGLWDRARDGDCSLERSIKEVSISVESQQEIQRAVSRLGERLAVRSSGLDEDGRNSSFAGQYATVLGVRPGPDLFHAIQTCWASAYASSVLAYRRGHIGTPGGMAVVIQTMVSPRVAGVLFTINPMNGSWREMTVESVWGLGEGVVSGRSIPDYYRVHRPMRVPSPVQRVLARARLSVLEEQVQPQESQLQVVEGKVETVPVSAARIEAPKLRLVELFRLCRLGLRIEAKLGAPQDIEWAQDQEGRFFILQSRPVTTTNPVTRSGPVLWTRRFGGERFTEPVTPLGWSIMRDLLHWFIAYPDVSLQHLGGEEPTRLYRHAPYFNVTVFRHLAFKIPGAAPPRFMMEMLPAEEEKSWTSRWAQAPDLKVYKSIFSTTFREKRWQRFRWNLFTNWRAWDDFLLRLDAALPALHQPVVSRQDALARHAQCVELAREYIKVHICSLLFANIWYQATESVLQAQQIHHLSVDLLHPAQASWTVKTNQALWELGRGERSMDDFLNDFGHRATNSWEIFSPRWHEASHQVETLSTAIASGENPGILDSKNQQAAAAARNEISGPTRWLVRLTQRYLLLREDQRFHFDRLLWAWKKLWLWIEEDSKLQLRYLAFSEVNEFFAGNLQDAESLIEQRQDEVSDERARRAGGDLPSSFLIGDDVPDANTDKYRLQGMGISGGVVTGTARILRNLSEADCVQPGDILIARATDPSWTPLFLTIGGLVMEMGGMLSHGAVVAREYRLPAVVNVDDAMTKIKDGQTITIDGSRGVVWIR